MTRYLFSTSFAVLTALVSVEAQANGWLGPISEETGYWMTCITDPNAVVTRAFCGGSYCDNNWLYCRNGSELGISPMWWDNACVQNYPACRTSEEYFTSDPYRAVCPFGYALVGIYAEGRYSDNLTPYCIKVNLPSLAWPGYWETNFVAPFSEEGTGYSWDAAQFGGYFSGFKCSGSYCDNMYYHMVDPVFIY